MTDQTFVELEVLAGERKEELLAEVARLAGVDQRPRIPVGGDLLRLVEETTKILVSQRSSQPTLFRSADGSGLMSVYRGDKEPRIRIHNIDSLRLYLARQIRWMRNGEGGREVDASGPSDKLTRSLLAEPPQALPTLRGIASTPFVNSDGGIVNTPGYDHTSGLYYSPYSASPFQAVPESPSPQHIKNALELLIFTFEEFPYKGMPDFANTLAALLLPFARALFDGPTPLHLVSKPATGTGATLLCNIIALIATGHSAPVGVLPKDDAELKKRITSALYAGEPIVMLDNVVNLDYNALLVALTADTWHDRILGISKNVALPNRCLWLATGNNTVCSTEMLRRIVPIGLDAKMERPHERTGFQIDDLPTWVLEHRGELVSAALMLVRAWVVAGRPPGQTILGGYAPWSRVIGGILANAGIPEFLANRPRLHEEADIDGDADRAFIGRWWAKFANRQVTVHDLYPLAKDLFDLGAGGERSEHIKLGKNHLARLRDRIVEGRCVRRSGLAGHVHQWQLVDVGGVAESECAE